MAVTNKLSDTKLRVSKPRESAYKLFDGGGLYLLIHPEGRKSWRLKYYVGGTEKLISLGIYPRVTLAQARKQREEAKGLLDGGVDPSRRRQEAKASSRSDAENTFEKVCREWFKRMSQKWVPSNSRVVIRRLEKDVFPWMGKRPMTQLTGPAILDVLRRIEERGANESAHRTRQYINSTFQFAINTHRARENPTPPAAALVPPKGTHYASLTDPREVGQLVAAIRGYEGSFVTRVALQLAPHLFVRPGELRAAEWTEIDLRDRVWRIPASRMKMKLPHLVPLSSQAVAFFTEIHALTGKGRFVFPSERGASRCMSANTLNAALRNLGYAKEQITSHGFRHMASTMLNEKGWNRDAIERQLAHADRNAIRATYNAAEYLPQRVELMQWWSDHLEDLSKLHGEKAKIVQ